MPQGSEPAKVQAFITELAAEALREGILDGLARFDESETNTGSLRPVEHRFARAFRPFVEDDPLQVSPHAGLGH